MDTSNLEKALKGRRIDLSYFETAQEAKEYLLDQIQNKTVGIGGSKTIDEMDLYDDLCKNNTVYWHWKDGVSKEVYRNAEDAEVYLSSVNAIAEDSGELINIDGRGNRVGAVGYGHGNTVYLVASTKKVCPDFDSALSRARNTAAVTNVKKLPGKRPCEVTGKCMDCKSPDRGCNVLQVIWGRPIDMVKMELVLIDEDLGF